MLEGYMGRCWLSVISRDDLCVCGEQIFWSFPTFSRQSRKTDWFGPCTRNDKVMLFQWMQNTQTAGQTARAVFYFSLSLSLASCSALGKIVSSLVMITMRVSGLWGQKDITRARPHWKRSCLDSTRPGISGQVRNIKTVAYPVLHWPTGQKSKDTKRGHSSFWGLTVGWGCTVGPRGLLNIMQLTGQQSITANI